MTITLDGLNLERGAHKTPEDGLCLLEAVAWFRKAQDSSVPFNDHPACVSPVLAAFGRTWNDRLPDERRQELKRYITLLPGTAGDSALDEKRAWMAANWLIGTYAPAWFRRAGLVEQAERLEALGVLSPETVPALRPTLEAIRDEAWAISAT